MPADHRNNHASREDKRNWRGISKQEPEINNPILIFSIRDLTTRLATTISKRGYKGTGNATIGIGPDAQALEIDVNLIRSRWRTTLGGTIAITVTSGPGKSDTPVIVQVPELSLTDHRWNGLEATLRAGGPVEPIKLNMRHD